MNLVDAGLTEILTLPAVHTDRNKSFLPLPNRVDVVPSRRLAPPSMTRTAFVVAVMPGGSFALAHNRTRGLEFLGGHIEFGENAANAARRETWEEIGAELDTLEPLGFERMVSSGVAPAGYRYPHPVGFQQFFIGLIKRLGPDYVENAECLRPHILSAGDALGPKSPLTDAQQAFCRLAIVFPNDRHAFDDVS